MKHCNVEKSFLDKYGKYLFWLKPRLCVDRCTTLILVFIHSPRSV